MLVIGITGLASSGKGEVAKYFESKGFVKLIFSDLIHEEAEKRGLLKGKEGYEEKKGVYSNLGDVLRKKYGRKGILAEFLLKRIKDMKLENVVIDGFRSVEEVLYFRDNVNNFYLINVEADERIRFERRKLDDPKATLERFRNRDQRDIKEKGLGKVLMIADFKIDNNGGLEYLHEQLERIIRKIT